MFKGKKVEIPAKANLVNVCFSIGWCDYERAERGKLFPSMFKDDRIVKICGGNVPKRVLKLGENGDFPQSSPKAYLESLI